MERTSAVTNSSITPGIGSLVDENFNVGEDNFETFYIEKECLSHVTFSRAGYDAKEVWCGGRAKNAVTQDYDFYLKSFSNNNNKEIIFGTPNNNEQCNSIIYDPETQMVLCGGNTQSDIKYSSYNIYFKDSKSPNNNLEVKNHKFTTNPLINRVAFSGSNKAVNPNPSSVVVKDEGIIFSVVELTNDFYLGARAIQFGEADDTNHCNDLSFGKIFKEGITIVLSFVPDLKNSKRRFGWRLEAPLRRWIFSLCMIPQNCLMGS